MAEGINVICGDPPYNLSKNYGNNHDSMTLYEYLKFSRSWLAEAVRVLTDDGSIYFFMGMRFISYLYIILEQELGLTLQKPEALFLRMIKNA